MDSFFERHLNDDHCFLCGHALRNATRSDEHVIPRWLQERHDLRNQRLGLLNGTLIPYRQLRIPCCKTCNNEALSELENEVQAILGGDFVPPTSAQEHRLFQWCSKILYGLLHRELALLGDRRDTSTGTIVQKQFLQNLLTFHHFMTSIRRPFRFDGFLPYSIFVAEAMDSASGRGNFDYMDHVVIRRGDEFRVPLVLSLRTGHYAIFCVFQDNGLQKLHFQADPFDRLRGVPLHPIQFLELACKSTYKHSKLAFSPSYYSEAENNPDSEVVVVPTVFPDGDPWEPWANEEYADMFCSHAKRMGFRGVPEPEDFYVGDLQTTWLFNEDGTPKRMPQP